MLRTHEAGTLRADHAGQTVTLAGWVARRRDHGGVAFLDLRDASGCGPGRRPRRERRARAAQRVLPAGRPARSRARPAGNENPDLPTGEIEVLADVVEVLSESAPLPFQIDDHVEVGEEARLRYRYLDLRRPGPAARDAAAQRGQPGRPRRPARPRASSRSRRRP